MDDMTKSTIKPLRIGTIGMDQRQRNALRMLFTSKCACRYVLVEEVSAELTILDLDVFNGEQLLQAFRLRHPEQPLILVSLKTQKLTNAYTLFVQKPIPVDRLIESIELQRYRLLQAEEETPLDPVELKPAPVAPNPATSLQHHRKLPARKAASMMSTAAERAFVGTALDIDPHNRMQREKIYYNPDHYLQGYLQQALNLAVRHNRNVAIEGPWPTLELFIENHRVRVATEERHLRPYCTVPDATLRVPLHLFDGVNAASIGCQDYPLANFCWKLALWASRGRVPDGTDLFQPIYLRRWPNFTRLVVTPYALAITALWAEQPRSLIDTAEHLHIPQRYVFAFYSAAKALQLAGEARRAVDTLIAPAEIEQTKQRGLFGRLLDRLRGDASQ